MDLIMELLWEEVDVKGVVWVIGVDKEKEKGEGKRMGDEDSFDEEMIILWWCFLVWIFF